MKINLRAIAAIVAGLLISGLLIYTYIVTGQRDTANARAEAAEAREIAFAARVKAKAEEISRRFADYSRRVEADQNRVSQEVSRDYQIRLAELRAYYDRLLRERANGAGSGRPGATPGLPRLPDAPGGTDGAAGADGLSLAERLLASEQALRLQFLQQWVREQAAVVRGPVPVD